MIHRESNKITLIMNSRTLIVDSTLYLSNSLVVWHIFTFYRVGIDLPTIEVRYEHLKIEADAYVGSSALPTFINFVTNFIEVKIRTKILISISRSSFDWRKCLKLTSLFLFVLIAIAVFSPYRTKSKEETHYSWWRERYHQALQIDFTFRSSWFWQNYSLISFGWKTWHWT